MTGASDYRIDVSTDNGFSFYVGSYFNQQVVGTSIPINGLTPGTYYYYRVRAANASGSSVNSSAVNALTIPGAPVANDALSVTSTTFLANWSSVSAAAQLAVKPSASIPVAAFATGAAGLSKVAILFELADVPAALSALIL